MSASTLAFLILTPFVGVFIYATWHEYRRYKAEGSNSYGLSYDPETNTTHVGAIAEDEDSYDPEAFEPDLLETETAQADAEPGTGTDPGPDHADTDDSKKDSRT